MSNFRERKQRVYEELGDALKRLRPKIEVRELPQVLEYWEYDEFGLSLDLLLWVLRHYGIAVTTDEKVLLRNAARSMNRDREVFHLIDSLKDEGVL